MKNITIYLAYPCVDEDVSEAFKHRMGNLKASIAYIPGVKMLESYESSVTACIQNADLLIAVMDKPSQLLNEKIRERCICRQPFRLFVPKGSRAHSSVIDCVRSYRLPLERSVHASFSIRHRALASEMPDPIEYKNDYEIIKLIANWASDYRQKLALA